MSAASTLLRKHCNDCQTTWKLWFFCGLLNETNIHKKIAKYSNTSFSPFYFWMRVALGSFTYTVDFLNGSEYVNIEKETTCESYTQTNENTLDPACVCECGSNACRMCQSTGLHNCLCFR